MRYSTLSQGKQIFFLIFGYLTTKIHSVHSENALNYEKSMKNAFSSLIENKNKKIFEILEFYP
jgi:hypothetical protein